MKMVMMIVPGVMETFICLSIRQIVA